MTSGYEVLIVGGLAVALIALVWGAVNKSPALGPLWLFLIGLAIGLSGCFWKESVHPGPWSEAGMRRILREELAASCKRGSQ